MKLYILLLVLSAAFLSSCASKLSVFPESVILSTSANAVPEYRDLGLVEVSRCDRQIFFFPIIESSKKMYDRLFAEVQSVGGDAIIDYQYRPAKTFVFFMGFISSYCYTATGTAIKTKGSSFSGGGSSWDVPSDSQGDGEQAPTKSQWDAP
jgi:hypothetical protein